MSFNAIESAPSSFVLSSRALRLTAGLFFLFTPLTLSIEAGLFFNHGRWVANGLAISYFLLMLYFAEKPLRWLMIHMVGLSYIGELLFCEVFQMYAYRTSGIPLYVPFGHAIVYASGYIWAHQKWTLQHDKKIRLVFQFLFSIAFLGVGILGKDFFTLGCSVLFFLLLRRKRWQNLYFFIAVCFFFIELVGTYYQCLKWVPAIFGKIPTLNPPIGAVFFYAGGDVLLAKIVQKVNKITV